MTRNGATTTTGRGALAPLRRFAPRGRIAPLPAPVSFVLLLLAVSLPAIAQPVLNFKRVEVAYPQVNLFFKVTCGNQFRTDLNPQHFEVRENGLPVKDAVLFCPDSQDCCISVSLVFDRSGSMQDQPPNVYKISKEKAGGRALIDSLNRDGIPCDEASIVSFNEEVTLDVAMTTNKTALTNAINTMNAEGFTAVWDAVARGIQQLSTAGNRCRAVVVLTDGGENHSKYHTLASCIQLAAQLNAKVFTIGFGMKAGSKEETELQEIAEATGAQYFRSANGDDIVAIYQSIKRVIKESYQECTLSYTSGCPDGQLRTVELLLKDFCNGSAMQVKTYQAPLDRSKFQTVRLTVGSDTCQGTQTAVVPVMLETPIDAVFSKCDFTVLYDRTLLGITGFSTAGTLLDGVPVEFRDIGAGHTFFVKDNVPMTGKGPLLYLFIRTADVYARRDVQVWISNWSFYAYCLIPAMQGGRVTILPREPILNCGMDLPASIVWNDEEKHYDPETFVLTARVRNSGSREATGVKVRLSVGSPAITLVSPVDSVQAARPSYLAAGREATASWELRAAKLERDDTLSLCVTITSDNHAPVTCCRTLAVGMTRTPALRCSLEAPDTVFFRDQYYDPEEFSIVLTARNAGSGQARDVVGQLLQDTRFTVTTPAAQLLAPLLPAGESASASFGVRMHPRQDDGYDTVRVQVQGADTDPAWCERPVFVQRERAPRFSLLCAAEPDSLVFSEAAGDYAPNPFSVTTRAANTGETWAEDCELMFVGPPRFTPVGVNLRPEGTMGVGDERTERWLLRALPRAAAGWDTLVFQVQGRGGLGRKIVVAECRVPVFVPEYRAPRIVLSCTAPDSLAYAAGRYTPDAFAYRLTLRNTGNAAARAPEPAILLPPTLRLAAGERAAKRLADIAAGDSAEALWMITPDARARRDTLAVCARVSVAGETAECCRSVIVPTAADPLLAPSCLTIDTLHIDQAAGAYVGNPFRVSFDVANGGLAPAERVTASIAALGPALEVLDSLDRSLGDIAPASTARVSWNVRALPRALPSVAQFILTATAANHAAVRCERTVVIEALASPALRVACSSAPEDTLFFDWSSGDFSPALVTARLRAYNDGAARASQLEALLVVPPGMVLAAGERAQKPLSPGDLEPGQWGEASWLLRPLRRREDLDVAFSFLLRCANAPELSCSDPLAVPGSPKTDTLRLPRDLLLRYGDKVWIPLRIDRTVGKDLNSYAVDLRYDPSVLSLVTVSGAGTLTAYGWVGARLERLGEGRARISDYTTGSPLRAEAGTLVRLYTEGVYRRRDQGSFGATPLHIDTAATLLNGGEIAVRTVDGLAYVTNDCLEPLTAGAGFELRQNTPNPFNPATDIAFTLPAPARVRLAVLDRLGRELRLAAEGEFAAGEHRVRFTADGLPSGIYFYLLDTPFGQRVRSMLLAK